MSDFWWGVLALPIVVVMLAVAASAFFGAWLLYEKWSAGRWARLQEIRVPEKVGRNGGFQTWTAAHSGNRGGYLSMLLAGGRGFRFRLTPRIAVLFVSAGKTDIERAKIIRRALDSALEEAARSQDEAETTKG
ncbi:hypothetical protein Achl_4338 (plasmid) [Pseudarthrobacter chlorophenolicus A6]|uniref:Uncharacterized protein n=1 Tax=Pseudarthrobacter chlorophenolicus (strain ATCC 700700 / DSM 12829 / CIP 107037 / JCM 12360 / KCTC 9906 / NCIMB 13794 / A6) TaxID=452863 RepID=B8HIP2_PSECP|nr:hypothetical protein [Pseudarthrobacter chlorophenolicus]ACL42289.1 hypothetical protein Achl_4338 [Pseudarthrobacter chlorophenolicus A6]SDQ16061.1 hypothetical protein SAMN04489738_0396 [Pseudarthrobacter chlorophenolicus]